MVFPFVFMQKRFWILKLSRIKNETLVKNLDTFRFRRGLLRARDQTLRAGYLNEDAVYKIFGPPDLFLSGSS